MQFVTSRNRVHTIPAHLIKDVEVVTLSERVFSVIAHTDNLDYTMGIYCKETTAQFEVANMADNLNGNINYTFMEYK